MYFNKRVTEQPLEGLSVISPVGSETGHLTGETEWILSDKVGETKRNWFYIKRIFMQQNAWNTTFLSGGKRK